MNEGGKAPDIAAHLSQVPRTGGNRPHVLSIESPDAEGLSSMRREQMTHGLDIHDVTAKRVNHGNRPRHGSRARFDRYAL